MSNRLSLTSCQQLSRKRQTSGLFHCCDFVCEAWNGEERVVYLCPGHFFPASLASLVNSPRIIEDPSQMKELELESQEPMICPSTSGIERLELSRKASSDPGIRERCRNIDAICASLASSSAHNQSKAQGLFKDCNQPSSQNGSKDPSTSESSIYPHPSPTHHDIELFRDNGEDYNSLSTIVEEEIAPNPALQDCNSPHIQSVCSLSSAEVVLFQEQDSSNSTEDCASACSSATCIGPGSTGSSTVINSPAESIGSPDSSQENYICPSPVPKSNQELCQDYEIHECHVPTHLIRLPSHQPDFFKCRSKKFKRILRRSEKEICRKVVKSDAELCRQYGVRPCSIRMKPVILVRKRAPFTIRYTRNYIAHVIRVGYNEQLHRNRVNWTEVYNKYLAGRFVTLRCKYFEKIAQKSVDDWLVSRKETKKPVRSEKEAGEMEARERRARLIRLKETELENRRVYYGDEGQYILANCEDIEICREAVKRGNRMKVVCSNVAR